MSRRQRHKLIGKFYRFLEGSKKRINLLYGSAGSGKSYAVAQFFIRRFYSERNKRFLVLRKTLPSLRITAYKLILDLLREYSLPYHLNKSEMVISVNDNEMLFKSLDDPEKIKCFHPDTEILTEDGFIPVSEVKKGQKVASLNPKTREADYRVVTNIWKYCYKGKMICPLDGKRQKYVSFCVTPEHWMIGHTRRRKELRFVRAKDLPARFYIPRSAKWNCGKKVDYYEIPDYSTWKKKTVIFPIKEWLQFLGWYISEGCLGDEERYQIYISQTKQEGRKKLKKLFENFPYPYCETKKGFSVWGKSLYRYLQCHVGKGCSNKRIPRDILNLHPDLLKYLFEALMIGDGHRMESGRWTFGTTSADLVDDVSELAIKLGYMPTVNPLKKKYYSNALPFWQISICKHKDTILEGITEIPYEGEVYCLEVPPYHTVLIRHRNRVMWCGQSYEGNYLWIEEATEITHEDFLQLNLRLRRKTESVNQMYLTFNPISKLHWIYTELIEKKRDDIALLHSTYKDNPFLSEEYVRQLEDLKNQDETYYQVYALGEWGVLRNIIYTNYELIDFWPESFDEIIYGLDFGYNNPTALLEIGLKDKEPYLRELLYETHLTNEDLITRLEELISNKNSYIYADPAEPARIEEIARAGFNIHLADKSVKDGIDFVKRQKLHILKDSVNLVKEIGGYKFKEDKDGNVLEEPVKFRDHLMDAMRYAIYTHLKKESPNIWIIG